MRFLVISNIPTPYRVSLFNGIARCMESEGVEFHVYFCAKTEPGRDWSLSDKDWAFDYDFLDGIHLPLGRHVFHANPGIFSALSRSPPDVVVCAGAWNMPTNLLLLIALKAGTPVYFWSEGHSDAVLHPRGLIAAIRRFVYRRFSGFWVPNGKSLRWAMEQCEPYTKEYLQVPNTVDPKVFDVERKQEDRDRLIQLLSCDPNTKVVVQVSRLESWKGVMELATSFHEEQSRRIEPAMLCFVGTGQLEGQLRGISPYVRVLGHLETVQVASALRGADAFVLNTKFDPSPLAPIEAALSGLAVYVSSMAGNAEELVAEGAGRIILDPNAPQKEIADLLDLTRSQLRAMGERSRAAAKRTFHEDTVVESIRGWIGKVRQQIVKYD
jgi:glycosyltransferase involved in cell wall biosynthesis